MSLSELADRSIEIKLTEDGSYQLNEIVSSLVDMDDESREPLMPSPRHFQRCACEEDRKCSQQERSGSRKGFMMLGTCGIITAIVLACFASQRVGRMWQRNKRKPVQAYSTGIFPHQHPYSYEDEVQSEEDWDVIVNHYPHHRHGSFDYNTTTTTTTATTTTKTTMTTTSTTITTSTTSHATTSTTTTTDTTTTTTTSTTTELEMPESPSPEELVLDGPVALASSSLCSHSSTIPAPLRPRVFDMQPIWRRRCTAIPHLLNWDEFDDSSWPGRQWCWLAVKEMCYGSGGHNTWAQSQIQASLEGLAPSIEEARFIPLLDPHVCERNSWQAPLELPPISAEIAEATAWLNKNVYIMVLNLPSAVQRWERVSQHLQAMGILFNRSTAVDMSQEGAYETAKERKDIPQSFDFNEAQRVAYSKYMGRGGIIGTVGVATAHTRTLRRALAGALESGKPMAMVLEDDALPVPGFAALLKRLVTGELPCDWEAVSLKSRCAYGKCISPHLTRVAPDVNEPADRCHHGVNYGFYTMLYRTEALPHVMKKLYKAVWQAERPHCLDIDVALTTVSEEVAYYAVPSSLHPGFLHEGHEGSIRYNINKNATESHNLKEQEARSRKQ